MLTSVDYHTSGNHQGKISTITSGNNERLTRIRYRDDAFGKPWIVSSWIANDEWRTFEYGYDANGRVVSMSLCQTAQPDVACSGASDVLRLFVSRDTTGNITHLTTPTDTHSFEFDSVHALSAYLPPQLGEGDWGTYYGYDLDGRLTNVNSPDSWLLYHRDPISGKLNRVTSGLSDEKRAVSYNEHTGQIETLTVNETGQQMWFDYDGSLLTGVAYEGEVLGSVSYGYDGNFWRTLESVNGHDLHHRYNKDGELICSNLYSGSSCNADSLLAITRHPATGLITEATSGSITQSTSYSTLGELREQTTRVGGSVVHSIVVAPGDYDGLGRITRLGEASEDNFELRVYDYNELGRLWRAVSKPDEVSPPRRDERYIYDATGNRERRITITAFEDEDCVYDYDAQDRLLYSVCDTLVGPNGLDGSWREITDYEYTPGGRLLSKAHCRIAVGDSTCGTELDETAYTYDEFGNLRQVLLPDGTEVTYEVDAYDRRIERRVDGVVTARWLYGDGLLPVAELDENNRLRYRFVYASRSHAPDLVIRYENGTVTGGYRIIADHLGSPRLVVDANSGAVALRRTYDAFGRVLDSEGSLALVFGYAGGLYDPLTGLVRFGARDYDAETGRWTAKDPIGFAGGDPGLYGYVLGDPVNFVDPFGLWSICANELEYCRNSGMSTRACGAFWAHYHDGEMPDLTEEQKANFWSGMLSILPYGGYLALGEAVVGYNVVSFMPLTRDERIERVLMFPLAWLIGKGAFPGF